ncbi:hypothetical protein D3C87_1722490 [compost metagenome]
MLLNHLAIEDETTGTQDHSAARTHPLGPGEIPFELADLLAQFIAIARSEVLQSLGTGSQLCMQLRFLAAIGNTPKLDTQHPPLRIDHQPSRRCLQ